MTMLRRATAQDAPFIKDLIHRAHLNPFGLDWKRFIVAVNLNEQVVGCGQIKPHTDGTFELASIAVQPEYQHQGIGTALITRLLAEQEQALYLICRAAMETYYQKFGFQSIFPTRFTPYFWRIYQVLTLMEKVIGQKQGLSVMIKRK